MTTKMDLLKDRLIELLEKFELVETDEQKFNLVERMLDVLTDNDIDDIDANNQDFKIKIITEGRK